MSRQHGKALRCSLKCCPFTWEGCLRPVYIWFRNSICKSHVEDLINLAEDSEGERTRMSGKYCDQNGNIFPSQICVPHASSPLAKCHGENDENPENVISAIAGPKCDLKLEIISSEREIPRCHICTKHVTRLNDSLPEIAVDFHLQRGSVSVFTYNVSPGCAGNPEEPRKINTSVSNPSADSKETLRVLESRNVNNFISPTSTKLKEKIVHDAHALLSSTQVTRKDVVNEKILKSPKTCFTPSPSSNTCHSCSAQNLWKLNQGSASLLQGKKLISRMISDVVDPGDMKVKKDDLHSNSASPVCKCEQASNSEQMDSQECFGINSKRTSSANSNNNKFGNCECTIFNNGHSENRTEIQKCFGTEEESKEIICQAYPNTFSFYANVISMNASNATNGEFGTFFKNDTYKIGSDLCSEAKYVPNSSSTATNNNLETEEINLSRISSQNGAWNDTLTSVTNYRRRFNVLLNQNLRRLSRFIRFIFMMGEVDLNMT